MIKSILADALGLHLDGFQRIVVAPASLSVVRYTPLRPFVERVNDSGELGSLRPAPKPEPVRNGRIPNRAMRRHRPTGRLDGASPRRRARSPTLSPAAARGDEPRHNRSALGDSALPDTVPPRAVGLSS